jgi:hypothetical protein
MICGRTPDPLRYGADVTRTLEAACGETMQECAREDNGRFSNPAANEAFYADTQTYNLSVVYPKKTAARSKKLASSIKMPDIW